MAANRPRAPRVPCASRARSTSSRTARWCTSSSTCNAGTIRTVIARGISGGTLKTVIRMALASAALFGCATEKSAEVLKPSALRANAPDWVSRGSGAFSGEKGKMVYGVGYVADAANAASRRAAADARALAQLGKVLGAQVAG